MKVSAQLNVPVALWQHPGWVGPRASLDAAVKVNILSENGRGARVAICAHPAHTDTDNE
jgi:hypothetical protein